MVDTVSSLMGVRSTAMQETLQASLCLVSQANLMMRLKERRKRIGNKVSSWKMPRPTCNTSVFHILVRKYVDRLLYIFLMYLVTSIGAWI